ncbi:hypothetical protein HOLleu_04315 [Holothuria leucospilota]|uniref:Uncharacterized protein n=1 Tax=Holothuria leucospilota TaxID=206669 RepID=A0A9Q1CSS3_HOLLE|nr:hypothetical protein HOLleu_04315 [Holothuria leucospilota]
MLKKGEQNKKLQQDVQALRAKLDKKLYLAQKCKRLQSKVTKQNETLASLKKVNQQLSRRLDSCRAALSAEKAKGAAKVSEVELLSKRKIKSTLQYAQGKIQQTKGSSSVLAQKLRKKARGVKKNLKDQGVKLKSVRGEVRSLKKVVSSLDSERAELEETMEIKIEERMQDFLKSQEVVTFQGGMYVDAVRALYMDLMGMNVGARNCESVVSLTVGLRDMVEGGTEETLQTLQDILKDASNIKEAGAEGFNSLIAWIKNTMSDRHSAEKKGNELLKKFRIGVLPSVVENWNDLSENDRNSASEVLKLYEKDELCGQKVGSAALSGVFVRGEAGTVKLVRLVCKSVQERACGKSGKPVDFLTFLSVTGCEKRVDLVPFKGNRFNILFKNGGVVYYLYDELCKFFDSVKDDNKLMKVVFADLKVKAFKAGVRALGLVNKVITSPLWRVLNGVKENGERLHILDMNEKYDKLVKTMHSWSKDALPVLKGE